MKNVLVAIITACLLGMLSAGCGGEDSKSTEPVPTGPAEEVVFSEDLKIPMWAQSVIPYGGGTDITLSGLEKGQVNFTRRSARKFELVVCYRTEKRLLITLYSDKERYILTAPSGRNGNVAFTLTGYKLSGENRGTIKFSFPGNMYGMYNVAGDSAKVYAFCIAADEDDSTKDLDNPKPFQAISNVVQVEMEL